MEKVFLDYVLMEFCYNYYIIVLNSKFCLNENYKKIDIKVKIFNQIRVFKRRFENIRI